MTIKGTLIVGFILALAVAFGMGAGVDGLKSAFMTWLHVMAGVVWIGLLYYFNFVQVPGVGNALAEANDGPGPAAINKYIAPIALLWFRMAAAVTWLSGVSCIRKSSFYKRNGCFHFSRRLSGHWSWCMVRYYHVIQCLGSYLAKPTKNLRHERRVC